jgi:hypothetical protein
MWEVPPSKNGGTYNEDAKSFLHRLKCGIHQYMHKNKFNFLSPRMQLKVITAKPHKINILKTFIQCLLKESGYPLHQEHFT